MIPNPIIAALLIFPSTLLGREVVELLVHSYKFGLTIQRRSHAPYDLFEQGVTVYLG